MAQNKLSDLNAHLFAQLDRMKEAVGGDQIEQEVMRSAAIVQVARQITDNADLQLKAARLYAEHGQSVLQYLPQIGKASE